MSLPSLKKASVKEKTALLRADLDVPIKNGKVVDDFRIQRALPTIQYLMKKKAKIIIVSHLGRPKGWDEKFTLLPAAQRLAELLNLKFLKIDKATAKLPQYSPPHFFFFTEDIHSDHAKKLLAEINPGDVRSEERRVGKECRL